jgi:hypothetical protein
MLIRVITLLLLCAGRSSAHESMLSLDEALLVIKNSLNDQIRHTETGSPECFIDADESCPLDLMASDISTLVYPGGKSRCIFSDSTPFRFQVVRGNSKKVIVYFQGGGAWYLYLEF